MYYSMEKTMEEKAAAIGGLKLRREFFQYLQKQRDRVRPMSSLPDTSYDRTTKESRRMLYIKIAIRNTDTGWQIR